eukprot:TRINITY_DN77831_c0_g1_i1.p1 TRINITY_DN77831_c0_g1~~TRINITY_DN77831_c0_g1_i1.p1  ORF type:complete len:508 (+),score=112.90 TRINITY_DN77831_c0_g1_i1:38-1561(+)
MFDEAVEQKVVEVIYDNVVALSGGVEALGQKLVTECIAQLSRMMEKASASGAYFCIEVYAQLLCELRELNDKCILPSVELQLLTKEDRALYYEIEKSRETFIKLCIAHSTKVKIKGFDAFDEFSRRKRNSSAGKSALLRDLAKAIDGEDLKEIRDELEKLVMKNQEFSEQLIRHKELYEDQVRKKDKIWKNWFVVAAAGAVVGIVAVGLIICHFTPLIPLVLPVDALLICGSSVIYGALAAGIGAHYARENWLPSNTRSLPNMKGKIADTKAWTGKLQTTLASIEGEEKELTSQMRELDVEHEGCSFIEAFESSRALTIQEKAVCSRIIDSLRTLIQSCIDLEATLATGSKSGPVVSREAANKFVSTRVLKVGTRFKMEVFIGGEQQGFVWVSRESSGYAKIDSEKSTLFAWRWHERARKYYITVEDGDYQGHYLSNHYAFGVGAWKLWSEAQFWKYDYRNMALQVDSSVLSKDKIMSRKESNGFLYCYSSPGYQDLQIDFVHEEVW